MQFTQISLGELYRQRIDWLAVSFQPRTSRTARVCVCRENHIADDHYRNDSPWNVPDRDWPSPFWYNGICIFPIICFSQLFLLCSWEHFFVSFSSNEFRYIYSMRERLRDDLCKGGRSTFFLYTILFGKENNFEPNIYSILCNLAKLQIFENLFRSSKCNKCLCTCYTLHF